MQLLQNYDWPGNIRQLENVLQRAILLCQNGVITPEIMAPDLHSPDFHQKQDHVPFEGLIIHIGRQWKGIIPPSLACGQFIGIGHRRVSGHKG